MPTSPKLRPLQQWFCDRCNTIITSPDDGIVTWKRSDSGASSDYRILHKVRCDDQSGAWANLRAWLGPEGLIEALSQVDPGAYHVPNFTQPFVSDLREWTNLVRRLQVPYWEEARRYVGDASVASHLDGVNEIKLYEPDFLQELIRLHP